MKKIFLVAALLASLLLSSCGEVFDAISDKMTDFADDTMSTILGIDEQSENESDAKLKEIATLDELRDYIHEQKDKDIFEIDFKYVGNLSELDDEQIVVIATVCSMTYTVTNKNEYHITMTEYPGDRIVDAYKSNDLSKLNRDEKEAYDLAVEMVEDAKSKAEDEYELELLLHDMIIERVNYYDGTTKVEDPMNPPRHLTVVGALLDRKANCQGYSDAFYTLASIAGFEVGRMGAENSDGGHMLNTVRLDGKYYVVDTTFDDAGGPGFYFLLNAGRDLCSEYSWGSEMENKPIADKSDENYFYYRKDGRFFDDIDELAQFLFDEWYYDGKSVCHAMISGNCDPSELSEALKGVYMPEYASCSYEIWCHSNRSETYFAVEFE